MNEIEYRYKNYLLDVRKIKNETSVNEYIRTMPKVKEWFIVNHVCSANYSLWDINSDFTPLQFILNGELKTEWKNAASKDSNGDYGFMMATWNRWVEFVNWNRLNSEMISEKNHFKSLSFSEFGLIMDHQFILRYTASLLTKPFVILSGLTGSGKTKLAQAFAMWICEDKNQYALVPVGADWTNREPLIGYPNSLKSNHYVKPDSGVLDILLRAQENFLENDQELRRCKPYFLILDEMNLSHVERYFADFLSAMESGDEIKLYAGGNRYGEFDDMDNPVESSKIPCQILLPKNLFIVGTVNIDETTYMFSPKVLDRANTIEFRVSKEEMGKYLKDAKPLKMDAINSKGKENAGSFMQLAGRDSIQIDRKKHKDIFLAFFEKLQTVAAEFGYRTANEMTELVAYLIHFGLTDNQAIDFAIMQKLLPKLHGSRSKLSKTLPALMELCEGKYPISMEKLMRMQKGAEENGFASYAEA